MSKKRRVTKVQLVDEKGATPKIPMLDYVLKLIPLLLIFGVIHQLWALYSIGKMGALAFFSWSQVINDTVVLLPFAALVLGSAWMGAWTYHMVLRIAEKDACVHRKIFLRTLAMLALLFASAFVLSVIEVFAYSEWEKNTLLSSMKLSAAFFIITFLPTLGYSLLVKDGGIFVQRVVTFLVVIIMSGVGLYLVLPAMRGMLASNWCSWKGDQYTTIGYMNDRYLFSTGTILNDSGALIGTGTVVYVRNDENKFVGCKPRVDTQSGLKK